MFANAKAKSYYSRPDGEVYSALNEGGKRVYDAIIKEQRAFFRKVDTTTIAMVSGTQTYLLPSDCEQILLLSERVLATDKWRPIYPANNESEDDFIDAGYQDGLGISLGDRSDFLYIGPYLAATDAVTTAQAQSVDFAPIPTDSRFVRIVYVARWKEITASTTSLLLPQDGAMAMEAYATAELLRSNGDDLADEYEGKAAKLLSEALNAIRMGQLQNAPLVTPYLGTF